MGKKNKDKDEIATQVGEPSDEPVDKKDKKKKSKKKKKEESEESSKKVNEEAENNEEQNEKKEKKTGKDETEDSTKKEVKEDIETKEEQKGKKKKKKKEKEEKEDESSKEDLNEDKQNKEEGKEKKKKKKKEKEEKEDDSSKEDLNEDKQNKEEEKEKKKKKKKEKGEEANKDAKNETEDEKNEKKNKKDKKKESKAEDEFKDDKADEKKKKKENKKLEDTGEETEKEKKKDKKKKGDLNENISQEGERDHKKEKKKVKKGRKKKKEIKKEEFDSDDDITEKVEPRIIPISPAEFQDSELFTLLTGQFDVEALTKVEDMIDNGCDVHAKGKYGETFLHVLMAPRENAPPETISLVNSLVHQFSNADIDVNAKDQEGNTPLHIAALNDAHPSTVAALIKCGADPFSFNHEEQDAFGMADLKEIQHTLKYFDKGLWRCVKENNEKAAEKLVKSWCKVDLTRDGKDIITLAEDTENDNIIECIVNNWETNALVHACLGGDLFNVKELVQCVDVDLNTRDLSHILHYPLLCQTALCRRFRCAKLLAKAGAGVNVPIKTGVNENCEKEPLFYFLMKRLEPLPTQLFKAIFKQADLGLLETVKINHFDLFYEAWQRNFDSEIISVLIKKGLDITAKDHEGYTVRDRVLLEIYHLGIEEIKEKLYFIDRHVISMATEGRLDDLKALANDNYDYINVADKDRKSIYKLAKKAKQKACAKFLEELYDKQKKTYLIRCGIIKGNLGDVKKNVSEETVMMWDRGGRPPLILAVLYERRFIANWLIKTFPHIVNCKDVNGRTALHYANALDNQDMEDALLMSGADLKIKDLDGRSPLDYRLVGYDLIPSERHRESAKDTYILDRYLSMLDAVLCHDTDRATILMDSMFGVTAGDFDRTLPQRFPKLQYIPLVFACIERKQEDLALLLLNNGASSSLSYKVEKDNGERETMTLLEAAQCKECHKVIYFIEKGGTQSGEIEEWERQAQAALQAALASMDRDSSGKGTPDSLRSDCTLPNMPGEDAQKKHSPHHQPQQNQKSSACVIL